MLEGLAAKLAANPSSPYFVGESLTIADLQVIYSSSGLLAASLEVWNFPRRRRSQVALETRASDAHAPAATAIVENIAIVGGHHICEPVGSEYLEYGYTL